MGEMILAHDQCGGGFSFDPIEYWRMIPAKRITLAMIRKV